MTGRQQNMEAAILGCSSEELSDEHKAELQEVIGKMPEGLRRHEE